MKLDLNETISEDPTTGAKKGTKLARFSLVPPDAYWALAEHYGKGAQKYSSILTIEQACATIGKVCTCTKKSEECVPNAEKPNSDALQRRDGVALATKHNLDEKISITPRDNEKTVELGPHKTETSNLKGRVWQQEENGLLNSALPRWMRSGSSKNKMAVPSATTDPMEDGSISIMTTRQGNFEDSSAVGVTRVLDAFGTIQKVLSAHQNTCAAKKILFLRSTNGGILLSGDRNWEKGYAWSKSVDALERHLNQFKMGEWADPETGSAHIIAVAWHAFALFVYKVRGLGTNDIHPGLNHD